MEREVTYMNSGNGHNVRVGGGTHCITPGEGVGISQEGARDIRRKITGI